MTAQFAAFGQPASASGSRSAEQTLPAVTARPPERRAVHHGAAAWRSQRPVHHLPRHGLLLRAARRAGDLFGVGHPRAGEISPQHAPPTPPRCTVRYIGR
jgi:hypothetical protein